jgi:4'-phosphopantetheinyl transferase
MNKLKLAPDNLHIWVGMFSVLRPNITKLWNYLSDAEKVRAQGFASPWLQENFIIARGYLRVLLCYYTSIPAEKVVFSYGRFGKPFLCKPKDVKLYFNLSHTEEYVLYAFQISNNIGVDIENKNRNLEINKLKAYFLTNLELEELHHISLYKQKFVLYKMWVRKEAFVKCLGKGLSLPLNKLQMGLNAESASQLISVQDQKYTNWKIIDLTLSPDHLGAIVTPRTPKQIEYFDLKELPDIGVLSK